MKNIFIVLSLLISFGAQAQLKVFKKGDIIDAGEINYK